MNGWWSGLASNLIAEFVGLVASVFVTYLVIERIIKLQNRRATQPLRRRLLGRIHESVELIALKWAQELGMVGPVDIIQGLPTDLHRHVLDHIDAAQGPHAALAETNGRRTMRRAAEDLASNGIELVRDVSTVAERFHQLFQDDLKLQERLEDVEEVARRAEIIVKHVIDMPGHEDETALITAADGILRRSVNLLDYVEANWK